MQKSAEAFVAIAIVVVGVVAGFDFTAVKGSGSTSSPCSDSVRLRTYYNQSDKILATTTLLIAPGSIAKVCIAYPSIGLAAGAPSTGPLACGPSKSANGTIVEDCSGQLAVVASERFLDHSSGQNITIAYMLRASEDAEGVYWFWVDCGEFFPLAVGAPPTSLTFPIIPGCVYEPNAPSRGSVTGISNMGVTLVSVA